MLKAIDYILRRALIGFFRAYKFTLSAILPPSCRFYPSCSEYAICALQKKSLPVAAWLIVRRVVRCNPFNPGGYDPVP